MNNPIVKRALYNLIRMNWLNEPTLPVEKWQVEDYRLLPLQNLFDRLKPFDIQLNRTSFIAYADECESPEDFTEHLIADRSIQTIQEDKIYLIVFELWRRLMNEKPSLSILCNELDYQIFLYDNHKLENPLALQDSLGHFIHILDENVDEGMVSSEVFYLVSSHCANDIESFLYDFIAEQIDEGNDSYARELMDNLDPYLANNKWFKLLLIRICENRNSKTAQKISSQIIEDHLIEQDLDYNLEFLSILAEMGDPTIFRYILKQTIPLIKKEEDLHDLLVITKDYFLSLDQNEKAMTVKSLIEKRPSYSKKNAILDAEDPKLATLSQMFHLEEI